MAIDPNKRKGTSKPVSRERAIRNSKIVRSKTPVMKRGTLLQNKNKKRK